MLDYLMESVSDPHRIFSVVVAIATAATVLTIALPLLEGDTLSTRMKSVANERERIRGRFRARAHTPGAGQGGGGGRAG